MLAFVQRIVNKFHKVEIKETTCGYTANKSVMLISLT